MKPTDKKAFAEVVIAFAELKGKALSLPAVELYWMAMQDWELSDFKAAAVRLLKTSEFMPTPKNFEDLRNAGRSTAGEAFGQAVLWARNGSYKHPAKSPQAMMIDRVMTALGGWIVLCQCEDSKLHFLEKRFCEHFEAMQDAGDTREALPGVAYFRDTPLSQITREGAANALKRFA